VSQILVAQHGRCDAAEDGVAAVIDLLDRVHLPERRSRPHRTFIAASTV
jgi:hypothetical protein